jgi:hypothetical protein
LLAGLLGLRIGTTQAVPREIAVVALVPAAPIPGVCSTCAAVHVTAAHVEIVDIAIRLPFAALVDTAAHRLRLR